jgi:hypothetical protein
MSGSDPSTALAIDIGLPDSQRLHHASDKGEMTRESNGFGYSGTAAYRDRSCTGREKLASLEDRYSDRAAAA